MKRFSFRLLFLGMIFVAGIFYGIDVMSTDNDSISSLPEIVPLPSKEPEAKEAADTGLRQTEGGDRMTVAASAGAASKNEFGREGNSPAGPFRPEPELRIQESFLNKLLNKIGEVVRWLCELVMKILVSLVDSLFG
ncbi:hypothetical protein [Paenibacillus sp. J2TS4]|uniref:hypothetical protein n=1 Tax=Paenibacillus sp. J2TS4 TaxID=2807194 RepID=UPI001BCD0A1D|nr:hypothetical protein [Paenibacillus sp. J2TS4]